MAGEFVSIPVYAKLRGVSPQYVRKLIQVGKLSVSCLKIEGKRKLVNVAKANRALDANLDHVNRKTQPKTQPCKKRKTQPKRDQQTKDKKTSDQEKQEAVTQAGFEDLTFSEARTWDERYKAALRKLKYEKEMGTLVEAERVKQKWIKQIVAVKTKILGIKSKCAPSINEMINDSDNKKRLLAIIDTCAREALEDIADGKHID